MNAFRAKRIADHLTHITTFQVRNKLHGLVVNYRGNQGYFEGEDQFWPFIFRVAQASHEENAVAEVEARLKA
ncbi:MAG: hypothetical protein BMS9Abin18_0202 [Zetaproteobacteria bacterium]|nr:MAG: hypothetical protein BMS9Abin18_0202 [Zetaproteobacteria bacterium]